MQRKALGNRGEALAKVYLEQRGFQVLESNWRSGRLGEIDMIAYETQSRTLVFIEVKTRSNASFGAIQEAMSPKQQGQVRALAEMYLGQTTQAFQNIRFDVVLVQPKGVGEPHIEHIPNAF